MSNEAAVKNAPQTVTVSSSDLPLSCPPRNQPVWNQHPRVYLPIRQTGEAVCPYCSTRYILQD